MSFTETRGSYESAIREDNLRKQIVQLKCQLERVSHVPEGMVLVPDTVEAITPLGDALAEVMDHPQYADEEGINRVWKSLIKAAQESDK